MGVSQRVGIPAEDLEITVQGSETSVNPNVQKLCLKSKLGKGQEQNATDFEVEKEIPILACELEWLDILVWKEDSEQTKSKDNSNTSSSNLDFDEATDWFQ